MIKSSSAAPEKEIVTSVSKLNGKTPTGDLNDKWSKYKSSINKANFKKKILVHNLQLLIC